MNDITIQSYFGRIARYYETVNRIMSFGAVLLWRRKLIKQIKAVCREGVIEKIVDLACGTGELTFLLKKAYPSTEVIGIDFCPEMLKIAKNKANKQLSIKFLEGNAESLPLPDQSTDIVTISFGFRNFQNQTQALKEIHRILKPNGHLFILEFSQPLKCLRPIYFWYLKSIAPNILGQLLGLKAPYKHLGDSVFHSKNRTAFIQTPPSPIGHPLYCLLPLL